MILAGGGEVAAEVPELHMLKPGSGSSGRAGGGFAISSRLGLRPLVFFVGRGGVVREEESASIGSARVDGNAVAVLGVHIGA